MNSDNREQHQTQLKLKKEIIIIIITIISYVTMPRSLAIGKKQKTFFLTSTSLSGDGKHTKER